MQVLYFGSVKLIESASIEDIKKIDGINDSVANKIYNFFNKFFDNKDYFNLLIDSEDGGGLIQQLRNLESNLIKY